jgi:hypothetical protein
MIPMLALIVVTVISVLFWAADFLLGSAGWSRPNINPLSVLVMQGVTYLVALGIITLKTDDHLSRPDVARGDAPAWMAIGARLFGDANSGWLSLPAAIVIGATAITAPAIVDERQWLLFWGWSAFLALSLALAGSTFRQGWQINGVPSWEIPKEPEEEPAATGADAKANGTAAPADALDAAADRIGLRLDAADSAAVPPESAAAPATPAEAAPATAESTKPAAAAPAKLAPATPAPAPKPTIFQRLLRRLRPGRAAKAATATAGVKAPATPAPAPTAPADGATTAAMPADTAANGDASTSPIDVAAALPADVDATVTNAESGAPAVVTDPLGAWSEISATTPVLPDPAPDPTAETDVDDPVAAGDPADDPGGADDPDSGDADAVDDDGEDADDDAGDSDPAAGPIEGDDDLVPVSELDDAVDAVELAEVEDITGGDLAADDPVDDEGDNASGIRDDDDDALSPDEPVVAEAGDLAVLASGDPTLTDTSAAADGPDVSPDDDAPGSSTALEAGWPTGDEEIVGVTSFPDEAFARVEPVIEPAADGLKTLLSDLPIDTWDEPAPATGPVEPDAEDATLETTDRADTPVDATSAEADVVADSGDDDPFEILPSTGDDITTTRDDDEPPTTTDVADDQASGGSAPATGAVD